MATQQSAKALLTKRATLIDALGRAESFLQDYVEQRDKTQVPLRLSYIDGIWANLEEVQGQLELMEEDEEGRKGQAIVRAVFEPRLFAIKADLISKFPVVTTDTRNPNPHHTTSSISGLKLPTISLPEFDGNYMQWLAFHDTFLALIHENSDVPEIQKFHYLKAALKGEAAQLVESITISSANYSLAWNSLVGRYANDYLLKKRHLQALFEIPSMKKETAATLHALVDDFERHTKILGQLGEPTKEWSTLLEHLLCTRLHDDTLKAWEDHASTSETPDYDCLINFLQRRMRVLESISVNNHASPSTSTSVLNSSRKPSQFRLSSYTSTSVRGGKCPACNQEHALYMCSKFHRLSLSERRQFVSDKRLCHNCLKSEHIARNCTSTSLCKECQRSHHTLLHPSQSNSHGRSTAARSSTNVSTQLESPDLSSSLSDEPEEQAMFTATVPTIVPGVSACAASPLSRENVFLLTVLVNVVDAFGNEHLARALLDSGSQPNLITQRMARVLRLKRNSVNVTIQGAGKLAKPVRESVFTEIKSRDNKFTCGVNFLVMDSVTANLPAQDISTAEWRIPKELVLADPTFNRCQQIDMVLGAKHFYSFFNSAARFHLGNGLPLLVDSVFGWIVTGSAVLSSTGEKLSTSALSNTTTVAMVSLEESVEKFWKTEELTMTDNYSVEERQCESLYESTVTRNEEGRYLVRLPKKPDFNVMLGESKSSAFRRYELLERRLERNPKLKEDYHSFMREYLSLGHMRLVEANDSGNTNSYYLPHHPVVKEASTTTKVRVVFDGSARTSTGFSLNEALCVGPVVQDDLLSIVLRFRTYRIALVSDIAKMYRQVLVHHEDVSLQRIFWRFSPATPVQTYELLTVTYGLTPSSFLSTRTLQQLAKDEGDAYPVGGPALKKNFYVDDFIGGADTIEEAIQLRKELQELLSKGGFELRKWTSNRLEVLHGLENEQIGTQSSLHFNPNETIKALGISWEPEHDQLRFDSNIQTREGHPTKRSILSDIARLFDPLGLIAPIVVRAKIIMQELWLLSCGWDDPVPSTMRSRWENFYHDLPKISSYRIDRYAFSPNAKVQLHVFADASKAAYGACIYARCENVKGEVQIQLLAAKSRVAPLQRQTIARLELCACVVAAHLHHRVLQSINLAVTESFFWSDSSVCLQWLRSPPNVWETYIANRVSEVQCFTHNCRWNHIAGVSNPADLVSRGVSVDDFLSSGLWKNGPAWLAKPPRTWPISNPPGVPEELLEVQSVSTAVHVPPTINPWFLRWSSYLRLLHVIGLCLRFIGNARAKARTQPTTATDPVRKTLSVNQLNQARTLLNRLAQQDAFQDEIKVLKQGKQETVPKSSHVRKLSPFIDPEGVVRVGGRLNFAQLPYQSKHPVLLPNNHPYTKLVAEYFHRKLIHGGGRLLLTALREEYWPLNGRRLVHNVVRNCFRCSRQNPAPLEQQIGQLPASRVVPSRPFAVTGVDYAGPLYLKPVSKKTAPAKAYLCLFVCFATKAVHLELVGDLSTQGFLAALRRFVSDHGVPTDLHSDNGKNFEGAKSALAELFAILHSPEQQDVIHSDCADQGINWHLTPPKAPHFGGLWEAAIKVAKRHLFRQLGTIRLSYEDMFTVLRQIQALMNSRPLLPLTEDPNDLAPLTPAHFLIGSSMNALPNPDLRRVPKNRLDHHQQLQLHVQQFWTHWQREYLQELQKDTKLAARNDGIQLGRLVVVVDENAPRIRWPLARIVQLHPGKDKITRVVTLRTAKGNITRPITKICLLPHSTEGLQDAPAP